jgi:uncharacterized protein YdhG (YjbR/CyaY superfamily)
LELKFQSKHCLATAPSPLAEETISYQLPAFRLGRTFIYFAGFKNHIGIYPPIKRDRALLRELRPYLNEKNNLKFSLAEPIPYELISRVALTLSMEYAKPSRNNK